jgi:hypothetical protein
MSGHVTDSDIAALRAGTLDFARAGAAGAHVRECPQCAARVWGSSEVQDAAVEVVRNAVDAPPSRMRWVAAVAAAIVIAIAVATWVLMRPVRHEAPLPQPTVVEHRVPKHPWDSLVAGALRGGNVDRPAWLRRRGTEVVRGPGDRSEVRLLAPAGVAVESLTPELRWTPSATCEVTIARNGDTVATSGRITGTSWTPPLPLVRGASYDWQVSVGVKHATAHFRVLDDGDAALLASVRATGDPTAIGIVAAHLGVLDEAVAQLDHSPDLRARNLAEKIRHW